MVCKRVAVLQAIPVDLFHHDSLGANRLSGTWTHGVLSINVFLSLGILSGMLDMHTY